MDRVDAKNQYLLAQKAGMKYYKDKQLNGGYPYPQVLDEILDETMSAGRQDLGIIDVPSEQIVGTKSAGRVAALAGNFMPLLKENTEFAMKWIALCEAHLGPDGIREPIKCYEYMGRFYVEEGNKRVSVLKSYEAPTIPARVIRILPFYSEDRQVRDYYSFLHFYECTRLYSVRLSRGEDYQKLLAALGCEPDRPWTEVERRSFCSAFTLFSEVFKSANTDNLKLTAGDALLIFLQVYSLQDIKDSTRTELMRKLSSVWGDVKSRALENPIEVRTEPAVTEKSVIAKLFGVGMKEHLNVAFIYAYDPDKSVWTRAHVHGQKYLERVMGNRVTVRDYYALDRDYEKAMELAVTEGAEVIFATTPQMVLSCRKIAAEHPGVRILNCSISQPYTSIRSYHARIYETKFITGALAGAMADGDIIGYVANYPILGVPADINAFALGARLTNPRARIRLVWSCTDTDPVRDLILDGVTVISNRDASNAENAHWAYEWGTYKLQSDGSFLPLAVPCWDWGRFYEQVIYSFLNGSWDLSKSRLTGTAINYWWGMNTGVIDVQLSPSLPAGMKQLAEILRSGIIEQRIRPFRCSITDQNGVLRNKGADDLTPEDIINMDWLCDNVDGRIPLYDELKPIARETVRILGLNRDNLPVESEEKSK